jgi:sugar fermentation stimulation protein A
MAGQPGTYLLLLRLDAATELTVGRLGPIVFRAGWYVYAGSALGGLDGRLRRHARRTKPRHWHVDALREVADLELVTIRVGREKLECAAAARVAALSGAQMAVAGFGASDCRCAGHLTYFERAPDLRLDSEWTISLAWGGRTRSPAASLE